jgi:hypothetical protein
MGRKCVTFQFSVIPLTESTIWRQIGTKARFGGFFCVWDLLLPRGMLRFPCRQHPLHQLVLRDARVDRREFEPLADLRGNLIDPTKICLNPVTMAKSGIQTRRQAMIWLPEFNLHLAGSIRSRYKKEKRELGRLAPPCDPYLALRAEASRAL